MQKGQKKAPAIVHDPDRKKKVELHTIYIHNLLRIKFHAVYRQTALFGSPSDGWVLQWVLPTYITTPCPSYSIYHNWRSHAIPARVSFRSSIVALFGARPTHSRKGMLQTAAAPTSSVKFM